VQAQPQAHPPAPLQQLGTQRQQRHSSHLVAQFFKPIARLGLKRSSNPART
jgi:hypothetical protein